MKVSSWRLLFPPGSMGSVTRSGATPAAPMEMTVVPSRSARAAGVSDDHGHLGAGAGDELVAQGAPGRVQVGRKQSGTGRAVAVDSGGGQLVAKLVRVDDRAALGGREVVD
ncbi:hypothetical protein PV458_03600 [Streptomyces sp. MN03-5084-2B]|nr:hypothetical protein [Streptomyces sp. MN03-5084-2B]